MTLTNSQFHFIAELGDEREPVGKGKSSKKKVADELFSLYSRRVRGYEKNRKQLVKIINIANECLDYIILLLEAGLCDLRGCRRQRIVSQQVK